MQVRDILEIAGLLCGTKLVRVIGAKYVRCVHSCRLPVSVVIHQGSKGTLIQPAGLNRCMGGFHHWPGRYHDIAAGHGFLRCFDRLNFQFKFSADFRGILC